MIIAFNKFGVLAILALQLHDGAMDTQRICIGAVLSHVKQVNLAKLNVMHSHGHAGIAIMPTIRKFVLVKEEEFSMSEDCCLEKNEVPTIEVP